MAEGISSINVEKDIRAIIAEVLEEDDPEKIDGAAHFVKDLGMDSMMALEILAAIEKKYRIVLPEDTLLKFTSLNQTVKIVKGVLDKR
ncbi:MAG TPA: acyl carrier protein [Candidatus Omnitrophota bacterium]|nr:acyl carrier protein [Candidatus Omnitrophota bacterium]